VIVVEHDLSVLDYLSDFICCLYGVPGAYGVVTLPFSVREGINIFLEGFVPTENLRFREISLSFKLSHTVEDDTLAGAKHRRYSYPNMVKSFQGKGADTAGFKLEVEAGDFTDSEIIVLLGQNGTGKTTFIRMLAGLLPAAPGYPEIPKLNMSYKPQKIAPKFEGTVRDLLQKRIREAYLHPQFVTDVTKPMLIEEIIDQEVLHLSGGELQRVALVLALGKPADIYLIDEPSAYLDTEQRSVAARVTKRYILHAKKTAFIVEHDVIAVVHAERAEFVAEQGRWALQEERQLAQDEGRQRQRGRRRPSQRRQPERFGGGRRPAEDGEEGEEAGGEDQAQGEPREHAHAAEGEGRQVPQEVLLQIHRRQRRAAHLPECTE
jgi:ATP-binding cassette subfamily E protein 1